MKYWFRQRRYGMGWSPSTKEGWMVIMAYAALMLLNYYKFGNNQINYVFFTLILLLIAYKKGPKLTWSWGK